MDVLEGILQQLGAGNLNFFALVQVDGLVLTRCQNTTWRPAKLVTEREVRRLGCGETSAP